METTFEIQVNNATTIVELNAIERIIESISKLPGTDKNAIFVAKTIIDAKRVQLFGMK